MLAQTTKELCQALADQGHKVCVWKDCRIAIRYDGEGATQFLTYKQARKLAGLADPSRPRRKRISAYGDYATIAMINRVKL